MLKKIFKLILIFTFGKLINLYLKKNNYIVIFRHGSSIGDHVYMSGVIREIYNLNKKILLFTNYYEIYLHNPRIHKLYKIKKKSNIWFFLKSLKSSNILEFNSIHANKENHEIKKKYFLNFHHKKCHLAEAMSEHFNMNLDFKKYKNEFFFSETEKNNFSNELNLPNNFSLIQSVSKNSFTKNKEWKIEGMQNIIDHFDNVNWFQIGLSSEPNLRNCGKFLDLELRKLAFVISKCDFLVTYEGLFNHLASCFEKKNFLIHTGFLHEEAFFYKNNIIIERNKNVNCYPCYSLDCTTHYDSTLKNITDEFVIKKIKQNI